MPNEPLYMDGDEKRTIQKQLRDEERAELEGTYRTVKEYHYALVVKGSAYDASYQLSVSVPRQDYRYYVAKTTEHRDPIERNKIRETVIHVLSREPLTNPLNEWYGEDIIHKDNTLYAVPGSLLLWTLKSESTFTE